MASRPQDSVKIHLHVKNKTIVVDCGDGQQKLRWLANVGVARYDDSFGRTLGPPRGLTREGGRPCDLSATIWDEFGLADASMRESKLHAFVVLKSSHVTHAAASDAGGGAQG